MKKPKHHNVSVDMPSGEGDSQELPATSTSVEIDATTPGICKPGATGAEITTDASLKLSKRSSWYAVKSSLSPRKMLQKTGNFFKTRTVSRSDSNSSLGSRKESSKTLGSQEPWTHDSSSSDSGVASRRGSRHSVHAVTWKKADENHQEANRKLSSRLSVVLLGDLDVTNVSEYSLPDSNGLEDDDEEEEEEGDEVLQEVVNDISNDLNQRLKIEPVRQSLGTSRHEASSNQDVNDLGHYQQEHDCHETTTIKQDDSFWYPHLGPVYPMWSLVQQSLHSVRSNLNVVNETQQSSVASRLANVEKMLENKPSNSCEAMESIAGVLLDDQALSDILVLLETFDSIKQRKRRLNQQNKVHEKTLHTKFVPFFDEQLPTQNTVVTAVPVPVETSTSSEQLNNFVEEKGNHDFNSISRTTEHAAGQSTNTLMSLNTSGSEDNALTITDTSLEELEEDGDEDFQDEEEVQQKPCHFALIECLDELQGCSEPIVRRWAAQSLFAVLEVLFNSGKLTCDESMVLHIAFEHRAQGSDVDGEIEEEDYERYDRPIILLSHVMEAVSLVWNCSRRFSSDSNSSAGGSPRSNRSFHTNPLQGNDCITWDVVKEAFRNSLLGKLMSLECRYREQHGDSVSAGHGFTLGGSSQPPLSSDLSEVEIVNMYIGSQSGSSASGSSGTSGSRGVPTIGGSSRGSNQLRHRSNVSAERQSTSDRLTFGSEQFSRSSGEGQSRSSGERVSIGRSRNKGSWGSTRLSGLGMNRLSGLETSRLSSGLEGTRLSGLDATRLSGLDATRLSGLDATRLSGRDATRLSGLDATRLSGLDATRLSGLEASGNQTREVRQSNMSTDSHGDGSSLSLYRGYSYRLSKQQKQNDHPNELWNNPQNKGSSCTTPNNHGVDSVRRTRAGTGSVTSKSQSSQRTRGSGGAESATSSYFGTASNNGSSNSNSGNSGSGLSSVASNNSSGGYRAPQSPPCSGLRHSTLVAAATNTVTSALDLPPGAARTPGLYPEARGSCNSPTFGASFEGMAATPEAGASVIDAVNVAKESQVITSTHVNDKAKASSGGWSTSSESYGGSSLSNGTALQSVHTFRSSELSGDAESQVWGRARLSNLAADNDDSTPVVLGQPGWQVPEYNGVLLSDCVNVLELLLGIKCRPSSEECRVKPDRIGAILAEADTILHHELLPVVLSVAVIVREDSVRERVLRCLANLVERRPANAAQFLSLPLWQTMLLRLAVTVPFDSTLRSKMQDQILRHLHCVFVNCISYCFIDSNLQEQPRHNSRIPRQVCWSNLTDCSQVLGESFFQVAVNSGWNDKSYKFSSSMLEHVTMELRSMIQRCLLPACDALASERHSNAKADSSGAERVVNQLSQSSFWHNIGVLFKVIECFVLFRSCEVEDSEQPSVRKRSRSTGSVSSTKLGDRSNREHDQSLRSIQERWVWAPLLPSCSPDQVQENIITYECFAEPACCVLCLQPVSGLEESADAFTLVAPRNTISIAVGSNEDAFTQEQFLVDYGFHVSESSCPSRGLVKRAQELWDTLTQLKLAIDHIPRHSEEEGAARYVLNALHKFYEGCVVRLGSVLELFDEIEKHADVVDVEREAARDFVAKHIEDGSYFKCFASSLDISTVLDHNWAASILNRLLQAGTSTEFSKSKDFVSLEDISLHPCMVCDKPLCQGNEQNLTLVVPQCPWLYGDQCQVGPVHTECATCSVCDINLSNNEPAYVLIEPAENARGCTDEVNEEAKDDFVDEQGVETTEQDACDENVHSQTERQQLLKPVFLCENHWGSRSPGFYFQQDVMH